MGVVMKCGHVSQATDQHGNPACVICIGVDSGATQIEKEVPALTGRKARCSYCKNERPSSYDLAFFEHKPKQEHDKYYCGCFGWD